MSDARSYFNQGSACQGGIPPTGSCAQGGSARENVCLDAMRVLDSCKDKDCFEDVLVMLTDYGQEIIEKTSSIRVKSTSIVCCNISADPIQFNRGFYQVTIRFYTKLNLEGCLCLGKTQDFEGVAVTEKRVVLYGGESNIKTFKSSPAADVCLPCIEPEVGTHSPSVVVDAVDPIALSVKVREHNDFICCHSADELPAKVYSCLCGNLCDYRTKKKLMISLGFFSVVRIERPAQLVVAASDYTIPDKSCVMTDEEEPCKIFEKMPFPVSEFCPPVAPCSESPCQSSCDCRKNNERRFLQ